MAVCKKCSAKIPGNEKVCPRCGASVQTGKKEVRGLKNRCPACGGKVSAKDKKCARCGKRLKKRGGSAPALYALIGVAFALIVMFIGISMVEKDDKTAPTANVETAQTTPAAQVQPQTSAEADAQSQMWGEDSAVGEEMQPWGEDAQPWGEDVQPWGEEAQPWGEDAAVSDEEFLAWGEEPEGLATWATPAPVTPGVVQSGGDADADEYAAVLFAAMEADASAGAVVITGPDGSTKQVSAAEAGNYVSSILSLRVTDLPEGSQVVFDVFDSEEMGWMVEVSITMPQGSRCFRGFRDSRFARLAVGSPRARAVRPWHTSWRVMHSTAAAAVTSSSSR